VNWTQCYSWIDWAQV